MEILHLIKRSPLSCSTALTLSLMRTVTSLTLLSVAGTLPSVIHSKQPSAGLRKVLTEMSMNFMYFDLDVA